MNQKEKEQKLKQIDEQISLFKKGLDYESTEFVKVETARIIEELALQKAEIEAELVPTLVEINNHGTKTALRTGKYEGYTRLLVRDNEGYQVGIISMWFDYNNNKYRIYVPSGMTAEVLQ